MENKGYSKIKSACGHFENIFKMMFRMRQGILNH